MRFTAGYTAWSLRIRAPTTTLSLRICALQLAGVRKVQYKLALLPLQVLATSVAPEAMGHPKYQQQQYPQYPQAGKFLPLGS